MLLIEKFYWKNLSSLQKRLILALSPYGAGFIGIWFMSMGLFEWEEDPVLFPQIVSCSIDPVSWYFWKIFNLQNFSFVLMMIGLPIGPAWMLLSGFQWYLVISAVVTKYIESKKMRLAISWMAFLMIFVAIPYFVSGFSGFTS